VMSSCALENVSHTSTTMTTASSLFIRSCVFTDVGLEYCPPYRLNQTF
jgi:hypothetical protein